MHSFTSFLLRYLTARDLRERYNNYQLGRKYTGPTQGEHKNWMQFEDKNTKFFQVKAIKKKKDIYHWKIKVN